MKAKRGFKNIKSNLSTGHWLLRYTIKNTCRKWKRIGNIKNKE